MNGEYELLPEERARRINREIFYRKLNQTWPESDRPASARRRSLDAAEQARLAAAGSAARDLLAATGVEALAGPSNAQQTRLFAHQLAAAHRLMMRLSGRADIVVTAAGDPLDHPEGLRLAHGAARLMERFRQGVAMLRRLRTGPDAPRRVENFWSGPLSDDEFEEERQDDISHGLDPDTGLPSEALAAAAGLSTGLVRPSPEGEGGRSAGESEGSTKVGVLLRRGRLNNGNPGGDFLAAPRCGARTRAGCSCRQPAMANGRCRFHGGKSTGPRTEAGRARARRNRLVHGLRSAEMIALAAAAAAAHRRLGALLAAARSRSDRKDPKRHTLVSPRRKPGSIVQRPVFMDPGRGDTRELEQSKTRTPAGHGVDRSESNANATILPFPRLNPVRSPGRSRLPRVRS
jgi:hypothetical protein